MQDIQVPEIVGQKVQQAVDACLEDLADIIETDIVSTEAFPDVDDIEQIFNDPRYELMAEKAAEIAAKALDKAAYSLRKSYTSEY